MHFCKGYDYGEKAHISKSYWNLKRKMWVPRHFSEIFLKASITLKKLQSTKNVCQFLSTFKLSHLWNMRGYVHFSCWIPIALRRSAHKNTFVLVGKFLKDLNISDQTQDGQNVCAVKQEEVPSLKYVDLKCAFRLLVCFLNFFSLYLCTQIWCLQDRNSNPVTRAVQPRLPLSCAWNQICFVSPGVGKHLSFHKKLTLESRWWISCMQWIIHDFWRPFM